MKKDRIIIFGTKGMLGTALVKAFRNHDIFAFDKDSVDITDKKAVNDKVNIIKPNILINAAAYTAVDDCEDNKKKAFNVNAKAVKIIAQACKKNKIPLLHLSTDYAFDGKKKSYIETSKTSPINIYGKSKVLGEKYLRKTLKNYYLIRTSWLFGKYGNNFVDTILKYAKIKKELRIVNDQFGSPTYTNDLAKKIKEIIESRKPFGIYHITNNGICTWFDFTKEIIKQKGLKTRVKSMSSKKLKRRAIRPKYSVLTNTKLKPMRHWKLALKDYLK